MYMTFYIHYCSFQQHNPHKMKITMALTFSYASLFLFNLMFELTSTAATDLTKSDDLRHDMLQKQSSVPIVETIDKNLDYMNPIIPLRQDQWVSETDNSKIEHIVQKRSDHRHRSSRHRHRHHHGHNSNYLPGSNPYGSPFANPYPSPWSNPYPGSWQNSYPMGNPPFPPRYRRSLSIFDNNRRNENKANNPKQWQMEQKSILGNADNPMSVDIDQALDKSFQAAINVCLINNEIFFFSTFHLGSK